MITSISCQKIETLITRQLDSLFILTPQEGSMLSKGSKYALDRIAYNFQFQKNKYYRRDGEVFFDPYHAAQYTIFLYELSVFCFKENDRMLANKVYYLNRALNGVDLFYEVQLPAIFGLDHPLGSVIGRAKYSNYFCFSQNCTVGNNNNIYPTFGENVILCAGASVLGNSRIGSNCIIAAHACVKDENVPDNSLVFGMSPHLIIKAKEQKYFMSNDIFYYNDAS